MASGRWANSDRRRQLPLAWPAIRRRILDRDQHQCTARDDHDGRCPRRATDVDHVADPADHSDGNLTSLCAGHHMAKTQREAAAARRSAQALARYPVPPHPGLQST